MAPDTTFEADRHHTPGTNQIHNVAIDRERERERHGADCVIPDARLL